jgi:acyl-CoA reductase-like NAD-dependent aldehyde dehydrogenase
VNLISGRWCAALEGRTYIRPNPAHPDDVIGHFPDSGPADAESAAQAAARAYPAWRDLVPTARGEVLHRAGDLIARRAGELPADLTREEGKPLALARGEVERRADVFRYFAGEALRHGGTTLPSARAGSVLSARAEPLGPVLLITPFNFPFFIAALKLGAALAAGNTVVWKPSPHVPVVHWPRQEFGHAPADNPAIRAISFTGSTVVGLDVGVWGPGRHVRVQQEMGGKNVLVIGPDTDLEVAARIAAEGAFGESGQKPRWTSSPGARPLRSPRRDRTTRTGAVCASVTFPPSRRSPKRPPCRRFLTRARGPISDDAAWRPRSHRGEG